MEDSDFVVLAKRYPVDFNVSQILMSNVAPKEAKILLFWFKSVNPAMLSDESCHMHGEESDMRARVDHRHPRSYVTRQGAQHLRLECCMATKPQRVTAIGLEAQTAWVGL